MIQLSWSRYSFVFFNRYYCYCNILWGEEVYVWRNNAPLMFQNPRLNNCSFKWWKPVQCRIFAPFWHIWLLEPWKIAEVLQHSSLLTLWVLLFWMSHSFIHLCLVSSDPYDHVMPVEEAKEEVESYQKIGPSKRRAIHDFIFWDKLGSSGWPYVLLWNAVLCTCAIQNGPLFFRIHPLLIWC